MTRAPTEMEVRVAIAIFASLKGDTHTTEWEFMKGPVNVDEAQKERFRKMARAAIRAMREPTQEMVASAERDEAMGHDYYCTWQGMIDAASPPEGEK